MNRIYAFLFCLLPAIAGASTYTTGEWRVLNFSSDSVDQNLGRLLFQLDANNLFMNDVSLSLGAELNYDDSENQTQRSEIEKLEIEWHFYKNWSLSFGKTKQSWGRADEINPTDFAFAEDKRWRFFERKKDRKLSRSFVSIDYSSFDDTLSFMVFPKHQEHRLPLTDSNWCEEACRLNHLGYLSLQYQQMGFDVTPRVNNSERKEFALRWTSRLGEVDYGVNYYYGSDHYKRLTRNFVSATQLVIEPVQYRYPMIGIELARSFGPATVRLEAAKLNQVPFYLSSANVDFLLDDDGIERFGVWSSVLSVDFFAWNDIYFNFQYLKTKLPQAEIITPTETNLSTLMISKEWFDPEIKVEARWAYDRETHSSFSEFALKWQFTMQWQAKLGLLDFSGESTAGFGEFEQHRGVFVSTQYVF